LAEKQQEKMLTNCTDIGQENGYDVSSLNSPEDSHGVSSLKAQSIATELSSMPDASPSNGGVNIHNSFSASVAEPADEVMHIDTLSQSSSPLAVSDMNQIIEHITNVHLSQTPLTPDLVASFPEREKRYFVSVSVIYYRLFDDHINNSNTILQQFLGNPVELELIIDHIAGAIVCLVASVCVCVSVCLSVGALLLESFDL